MFSSMVGFCHRRIRYISVFIVIGWILGCQNPFVRLMSLFRLLWPTINVVVVFGVVVAFGLGVVVGVVVGSCWWVAYITTDTHVHLYV